MPRYWSKNQKVVKTLECKQFLWTDNFLKKLSVQRNWKELNKEVLNRLSLHLSCDSTEVHAYYTFIDFEDSKIFFMLIVDV